jgi:cation:H+ antiporter
VVARPGADCRRAAEGRHGRETRNGVGRRAHPRGHRQLTVAALIAGFAVASAFVWLAGIRLSNTTDVLSRRFGLGEAIGGAILLAIATNLPEIAIVTTAAFHKNLDIATGNILGGIAIQTVVLAILDRWGVRDVPLTYRAASLGLVIEGSLVIAMLAVVVEGTRVSPDALYFRMSVPALLLVVMWVVGLVLVARAQKGLPWHERGNPPDGQKHPMGHRKTMREQRGPSTRHASIEFAIAALVTLAGGVVLERVSESLSSHLGLSGVLFGATVLAAATSLPELSTGLQSLKLGDYQLAVSDIFGGNAFLPVLFLPATLISGMAVLPQAHSSDVYLTAVAILLTVIYTSGLIFRPKRQYWGFGPDSLAVLLFYGLAVIGLIFVSNG